MRRKHNPSMGNLFQIFASKSKEDHIESGYLVWEGYGVHRPWDTFEILIMSRSDQCLTMYVYLRETGELGQLAQYWRGKVEYL